MAENTHLGAKVRGLRRGRSMTQVALAERLGISASYLNLIEHNRRSLSAPLLIRRAQRLMSKNFVEIIRDLMPDGLGQVEKLAGIANE